MSKREEHPIDDHFRQVLARAEVTPPPEVWQGVVRARAARGGGMAWWAWRWTLPALLLLGVGTYLMGTYLAAPKEEAEQTMAHFTGQGAGTSWANEQQAVVAWVPDAGTDHEHDNEQHGMLVDRKPIDTSADRFAIDQPQHNGHPGSEAAARMAMNDALDNTVEKDQDPMPMGKVRLGMGQPLDEDPRQAATMFTEADPVALADLGEPQFLSLRPFHVGPSPRSFAPTQRTLPPPYVLPKGQWWIGAQAARYEVQRRWHGQDAELVDALNATETAITAHGFGLLVGHDRHDGWGASLGVMLERSEQGFRYVDRKVEVEQEIITYFVTLNTEVFVGDVDTVTTYLVEETTTTGPRRLSVLRIPLEGHWHRQAGRWTWGFRAGMALELARAEGGLSLRRSASDGRVLATELTKGELRDRHPAQFLLSVGGDLGYMLHDRWRLLASPVYMFAPTAPTSATPVSATEARWGLQMRLTYLFNPCRK